MLSINLELMEIPKFSHIEPMSSLDDRLLGAAATSPVMAGPQGASPLRVFFKDARQVFRMDELGMEIGRIAFPAALALAADPIASLVDTAFIGRIGAVELAAVGVAIAVFNQASRITIFPLVSVTTSFVAEDAAACEMAADAELQNGDYDKSFTGDDEMEELMPHNHHDRTVSGSSFSTEKSTNGFQTEFERKRLPSVSSALLIGGVLGLLQAFILIFGAIPILKFMGLKPDSPMLTPACQYLTLRSLGTPAVLLSLAMQGVFRGLKDTKTPLYATVAGDATNIILDPIFIFVFNLGVGGAAIAHVISQYLIAVILFWRLIRQVDVLPLSIKDLQLSRYLKNGFLLLARVIAATFCVTLAASMAARQGSIPMAAFQICLQVWLATSLLADGLAVAGQAILASAFAKRDHARMTAAASRVLQLGMVLGLALCAIVGIGLQFASIIFTKDANVLQLIHIGIPFVALTQPINALAFVFDGINFGASDFVYSAYSMILVAVVSIGCLVVLSSGHGFIGIWIALTIFMSLRMFAGFWRIGTARGPWIFLRNSV